MTAQATEQRPTRGALALRALLAWTTMGFVLGSSGPLSEAIADPLGLGDTGRQALSAVIVGLGVVSIILWLHRRIDRRPLSELGLVGASGPRSFALGVLVTGSAAVVVTVPAGLGGWIDFGSVDWAALGGFLVVNACVAFGLEALPEEVAFRGYVYSTLGRRGTRRAPFVLTTILFCLIMIPTSAAMSAAALLFGGDPAGVGLAPAGEDPVTYIVLLAFFGPTLLTARIATGSLWTSIAVHLSFLTVNRLVFAGSGRDTGWDVDASPDAALLVLVYLALTTAVFAVIARRRRKGRVSSRPR